MTNDYLLPQIRRLMKALKKDDVDCLGQRWISDCSSFVPCLSSTRGWRVMWLRITKSCPYLSYYPGQSFVGLFGDFGRSLTSQKSKRSQFLLGTVKNHFFQNAFQLSWFSFVQVIPKQIRTRQMTNHKNISMNCRI